MPTKQGEALSTLLQNGQWDDARFLLQRIINVQTLAKSGWNVVWNKENVPSDFVYSLLKRIQVVSCQMQNKTYPTGLYPYMFHEQFGTLWKNASPETCSAFLRALTGDYRGVAWPRKERLKAMIDTLWVDTLVLPTQYSIPTRPERYTGNEEVKRDVLSIHSLEDLERFPQLKSLWKKTVVLLKAYLGMELEEEENEDDDWLVAHAIAQVDCLPIVMWFALKLYPEQVSTRDAHGNIPLHIAVTKPVYCQQYHIGIRESIFHHVRTLYPEEYIEAQDHMAIFLVKHFAQGATYMNPHRRVPLLVSLLTLQAQRATPHANLNYHYSEFNQDDRLQKLVEAAPQVLCSRDYNTKLYPFQLAASVHAPLNTIYMLLRNDPSALKYRRLSKRESDYERLLTENASLKNELKQRNKLVDELQYKLDQYESKKRMDETSDAHCFRKRARRTKSTTTTKTS